MQTPVLMAAIAAISAFPVLAQIAPGHSIVTASPGAMYDIDHEAGTVTQLTISATLTSQIPNCVLMTSGVTGFVGTNIAPGNVYSILVVGTTVTETLLNTTPTAGANVAQLAMVGARLYFTTQNASGALGILQSVPIAGGPVQTELDLSTVGAQSLANACCAIGTKVYIGTFNSSPSNTGTPCEVFEYDTVTSTGRLVVNLPPGGFIPSPPAWNAGIVNMHEDPLRPGILALAGVYGDLMYVDPVANTVVNTVWTGLLNGSALASGTINSFTWDAVSHDWIVGTRYGSIERWVGAQQAELQITPVGSTTASLTGIDHIQPALGVDYSYGAGCPGNGGWTPTDSSMGAPTGGNANFKFAVWSVNPGDAVILAMDLQNTAIGSFSLPYDLATFGAPGCFIRSGAASTQLLFSTGSGSGGGHAILPFPIPANVVGMTVYRQWLELQLTPTNALGIVVSNARSLTVQ